MSDERSPLRDPQPGDIVHFWGKGGYVCERHVMSCAGGVVQYTVCTYPQKFREHKSSIEAWRSWGKRNKDHIVRVKIAEEKK